MIPLKDDLPTRTTPFVTIGLITLNVLAFVYQISLEVGAPNGAAAGEAFVMEFGLIPCRLTGACRLAADLPSPAFTILSSMFLHGSFFHIAGNMLYLWIFGNNVEDTLGHGRFVLFYLASGVAAAAAQTLVGPQSTVPMVGASGAISGVLGAYFLLFPHASVLTLVIFGFFWRVVRIPALIVLGLWMVVQILNGLGSFGAGGGVAWFAHIGGFIGGMALLLVFRPRPQARAW
ncbi:MAG TPA: rhomboid family intramembrane serine protease [Methylomirabilota bacterium]|jgi:membrane associated rhomboid family serine protease|nr:rhomboid family intramembrane serine protease [Methylomirabilota bacterium]